MLAESRSRISASWGRRTATHMTSMTRPSHHRHDASTAQASRPLARLLTTSASVIGASAGALNAYLLSAKGPDELIQFWLTATNRSVLGVQIRNATFQGLFRWALGVLRPHQPFSIYPNKSLRQLIHANSRLEDLKHPLFVAATDYTQGKLKSFYASDLIDDFVEHAQHIRTGDFRNQFAFPFRQRFFPKDAFEVIVVDNDSREEKTKEIFAKYPIQQA